MKIPITIEGFEEYRNKLEELQEAMMRFEELVEELNDMEIVIDANNEKETFEAPPMRWDGESLTMHK